MKLKVAHYVRAKTKIESRRKRLYPYFQQQIKNS